MPTTTSWGNANPWLIASLSGPPAQPGTAQNEAGHTEGLKPMALLTGVRDVAALRCIGVRMRTVG